MRIRAWIALSMVLTGICLISDIGPLRAQAASAVPVLDMNRFSGTWYEIARYPIKRERLCARHMTVLFALGDKKNEYQMVKSCVTKGAYSETLNIDGKQDKSGNGELKSRYLLIFSRKHQVLALDPNYQWALIGSPDHRSLTVLSRKTTMEPELLSQIETKATSEGFEAGKLVKIEQAD